ncbi:alpha/beta hydrolase [Sinomonas sp. JGH33]|uniref:Alpha/beta hydrolase n=1 Tax=Sinomonas terricola TaxID=3110330 RepID=A0ABU5TBA6_9MICC|nr:alpha/beta hydrolase [Sinomonas sp. JGH33]MEA5456975.1 alpha/beta hydrolase [Sinomonas sp. JGH33]
MTSDVSVVFVHGLFGPLDDPAAFRRLSPAVCSAPDLCGYGRLIGEPVSLSGQVEALRSNIRDLHPGQRVHLVGHSIGAVYAFALADESPELVQTITTVEGNFTLADAFWSRTIAALEEDQAQAEIEKRLTAPEEFLAADGITATPAILAKAEQALAYQPWRTVWESAAAIVETTAAPEYEAMLRRVFDHHRVHLVAGERSVSGWDVPAWARAGAASWTVIPGVGHMMMLEDPEAFGNVLNQQFATA